MFRYTLKKLIFQFAKEVDTPVLSFMSTLHERMNYSLADLDTAPPSVLLTKLNIQFETILEKKGYKRFRKAFLDFLFFLLVSQRPQGYPQRWERAGLARELSRMPSMKHIFLQDGVWNRLRSELEHYLDVVNDGELRLASEQDFLDELGSELSSAKRVFYDSCQQKCDLYKHDLIAAVMHPTRIEKILNTHGFEMLEELFGY